MTISNANRELVASLEKIIGIINKMGIRIEEYERGYVKIRLPKEPNVNHIGTVYAGSLFSLADYAGGVLFSSCFDTTRYYPILKETTIRFKRFATTDVMVESSFSPEEVERLNKEADQAGKANWVMEFELKDAEGNICCIVNGSFQLRKA